MRERERKRDRPEKARGVELKGQQIRARKERPSLFKEGKENWATLTPGAPKTKVARARGKAKDKQPKSKLEIVRGVWKSTGKWGTQALRQNLSLFPSAEEAKAYSRENLDMTPREQKKADKSIDKYFKGKK